MTDLLSGTLSLVSALALSLGLGLLVAGKSDSRIQIEAVLSQGLLLLMILLGFLHFILPLSSVFAVALVSGLGGIGLFLYREQLREFTTSFVFLAAATAFGLVYMSQAMITNYDPGLYYHSFVAFLRDDQIVLGLANLHSRLGNWSSSFALSAWFENGPLGNERYRLANPLLLLVVLLSLIGTFREVKRSQISPGFVIKVFGVGWVLAEFLTSPGFFIAAPTPDTGYALSSVMALASAIDMAWSSNLTSKYSALTWALISVFYRPQGFVVLFVVVLIWSFIELGRRTGVPRNLGSRCGWRPAGLVIAGIVGYVMLAVALTGHPVYPVASLPKVFSWSVPSGRRSWLSDQITWIARQGPLPESVDFRGVGWIPDWAVRQSGLLLLVSLVVAGGATLSWRLTPPPRTPRFPVLWATTSLPVAVWFVLAPDPRFGLGPLAVFAITPGVRWLKHGGSHSLEDSRDGVLFGASLTVFLLACLLPIASEFGERVGARVPLGIPEQTHLGTPQRIAADLGSVVVTRPLNTSGPECGASLWCTPEDASGLRVDTWGPFTVLSRD
jgi:hypothetical protein